MQSFPPFDPAFQTSRTIEMVRCREREREREENRNRFSLSFRETEKSRDKEDGVVCYLRGQRGHLRSPERFACTISFIRSMPREIKQLRPVFMDSNRTLVRFVTLVIRGIVRYVHIRVCICVR